MIRPFGWRGHRESIRAMVEDAFRLHMGIVSANTQRRVAEGAPGRRLRRRRADGHR